MSKPKIHRLPAKPARQGARKTRVTEKRAGWFVLTAAAALLAAITFAALIGSPGPALHAQRQEAGGKVHIEPMRADVSPLSISEAEASPLQQNTIVIQGKDEAIVGQMAKIPAASRAPGEIESISKVDKQAGRELLSIISKY